ncbi:hypothetical protein MPER_15558 [Moniliophthora perniciosa FA553]|nr:hypothetical protein MPER_15558 [Moniliophthora perniciosa FA553]
MISLYLYVSSLQHTGEDPLSVILQDYNQDCLDTRNCQEQIVSIDNESQVSIFSLSTVATTFQLSVGDQGIINQADNINGELFRTLILLDALGFASTVTAWTPS